MNRKWVLMIAMLFAACFLSPRTFAATATGEDVYKGKCASCHGGDGSGQTTMGKIFKLRDFGSADVQKQSDEELTRITSKGKGKMPSFEGKLKTDQIGAVVGYIRTLGKGK